MDWDKLRIFHAVADVGSLTHAGDKLNLSQSAVSRQIRGLEESLNATELIMDPCFPWAPQRHWVPRTQKIDMDLVTRSFFVKRSLFAKRSI